MAMIKKSVTLTEQQNQWLQAQIERGLYASDSEVLRALIREKQEANAERLRLKAIRAALEEGEHSGISDSTPQDIKQRVLARIAQNG